MNLFELPILSVIVFLPLAGTLIVSACRKRAHIQTASLITAIASFIITLVPVFLYRSDVTGFQFVEYAPWIPTLGISYHVGIDGLSLFLLPLTSFLTIMAILVSWNRIAIKENLYYGLFLILETSMLGVFVAIDTVLFYVFWEAMLIPMFLIIGIWGSGNRRYAAIKFIIYTVAGSLFLLVGFIIMAFLSASLGAGFSFDLTRWGLFAVPESYQRWLFIFFFIASCPSTRGFPTHTRKPRQREASFSPGSFSRWAFTAFSASVSPSFQRRWPSSPPPS